MSETPNYMRFVVEMEVEVTDWVQAKGYGLQVHDDLGTSFVTPVGLAISHFVRDSLAERGAEAGFKLMSSSVLRRVPAGIVYSEMTLPEMPVRGDDGKIQV